MARVPQEPLELSEAERLRAARRAEREEAKRQKMELAQIEKEMRGPGPRWVLPVVVGSIVFAALLVFIGYRVWVGSLVESARVPFESSYDGADKALLRTYAAVELRQVEEMKSKAESGKLGAKATAAMYREADDVLQTAIVKANEAFSKVDFARTAFESLYNRATELKVAELLPDTWERVEAARAEATADGVSGEEAAKFYKQGSELLNDLEFSRIDELQRAIGSFRAKAGSFQIEEYAKAFPEESKELQSSLSAAKAAIEQREWQRASSAYRMLSAKVPPAITKLRDAKLASIEAIAELDQALNDAKGKSAERDARTAWEALQKERATIDQTVKDMEYVKATTLAKEATAKVAEMLKQIGEARSTLQQRMQAAEQAFQTAMESQVFYEVNLPDEWKQAIDDHKAMKQAVNEKEDMVSLLNRAGGLIEALQGLSEQRDEMLAGLTKVRDQLAKLAADPVSQILPANVPVLSNEILRIAQEAARAEEEGEVTLAVKKSKEWVSKLTAAIAKVKDMRQQAMSEGQDCGERITRFKKGIDGFRPRMRPEIDRLQARFLGLVKQQNFRSALPVLADLQKLVPEQRFTFDNPGAVIDNESGLMWASDGKGTGCHDGDKITWHQAFQWADELSFATYRDWRLPTEEELQVIGRLSQKERARAFPNTPLDVYWTMLPDTEVGKALAVDLKAVRTVLRDKNQALYVRAVRTPQ
jgi:translation elongation factor P/translation initiation factor 5A